MIRYNTGNRVLYQGLPGTVIATQIITSTSTRQPLPTYQRITVHLDANAEHIHSVSGAARHFQPALTDNERTQP